MQRSEQIGKLAKALALAQGEIRNAAKSSANPFYHSKYADLAECFDTIRGPLSKNALAIVQACRANLDEQWIEVETILMHESGEWIGETLRLPAASINKDGKVRFDPQSIGGGITYARRYGLVSLVGLSQDDDDGNSATQAVQQARTNGQTQAPKLSPEDALSKMRAAIPGGVEAVAAVWKALPIELRRVLQSDPHKDDTANIKRDAEEADRDRAVVAEATKEG